MILPGSNRFRAVTIDPRKISAEELGRRWNRPELENDPETDDLPRHYNLLVSIPWEVHAGSESRRSEHMPAIPESVLTPEYRFTSPAIISMFAQDFRVPPSFWERTNDHVDWEEEEGDWYFTCKSQCPLVDAITHLWV
jgi:hypothetical protein